MTRKSSAIPDQRETPDQQRPPNIQAGEEPLPQPDARADDGARPTGCAPGEFLSSPGAQAGPDDLGDGASDPLTEAQVERDEYLDALRRLQADFENYRKRMAKAQGEQGERAVAELVAKLLPVLDTLDMALAHLTDANPGARSDGKAGRVGRAGSGPAGAAASLSQVGCALTDALGRAGLERIDPAGQAFDPTEHDAVVLDSEADANESEVTEVLRAGYRWKGRVLRPAMVKVKG